MHDTPPDRDRDRDTDRNRDSDRYRPTTTRQRLRILGVTLATVLALWLLLIYRPGGHYDWYTPKPCKPGQAQGCIGGQANVMLVPATPASAAPAQP
jgi:hypothetical protein